jgi:alkanesulfonate monooxygenase SsuD/methylene tetrahydromethanopterin reductase-like flavin-dependent oxidoreductase (luciferase family)
MDEARERFHECWEIMRIALKGEPFTYEGRFHKVEKPITLRPHLGERRPNFYGAVSSPSSGSIMAKQGLAPLSLLNYSHDILAGILADWKRINRENGGGVEHTTFPLMTNVYIADTDEEARAEAKRYLPIYYQVQVDHYDSEKDVWKDMPSYQETGKMMNRLKLYTNPDNLDPQINLNPIGTPETVRRRLQALVDIGFNHFIIRNGTPGVPRTVRHSMMQRFAKEVMPHFHTKQQAA